jgi:hypothetical protein
MRPQRLRLLAIGVVLAAIVLGLERLEGVDAVLLAAPPLALFSLMLGGWYFGEDGIVRLLARQRPRRPGRTVRARYASHLRVPLRLGPHLGSLQRRGPPSGARIAAA